MKLLPIDMNERLLKRILKELGVNIKELSLKFFPDKNENYLATSYDNRSIPEKQKIHEYLIEEFGQEIVDMAYKRGKAYLISRNQWYKRDECISKLGQ